MMFLRLNRLYIPEVKILRDVIEADKLAAARCIEKIKAVEEAAAGKHIVKPL